MFYIYLEFLMTDNVYKLSDSDHGPASSLSTMTIIKLKGNVFFVPDKNLNPTLRNGDVM
jgi:hypothetical protein